MTKLFTVFLSFVLMLPAAFVQADDPDTFQVETISMKFKPGKNLEDVLSLREKFADFANAGDIQFGSRILVPWAVSKAALPDDQDWDALWIGFSPNTGEYSKALGYYLDNGDSFNADFDAVRTNVATTLMGGHVVFRSEAGAPEGVGATASAGIQEGDGEGLNNTSCQGVAVLVNAHTYKGGVG